jgi:hypothetical protein
MISDREFWLIVYRALMAVATAIKKKYLSNESDLPDNVV